MDDDRFDFTLSLHLQGKARELGVPLHRIMDVLAHPARVESSVEHPGQRRYIKNGLAVMVGDNNIAITFYLDRVITPLRPDQIAKGVQIRRKR